MSRDLSGLPRTRSPMGKIVARSVEMVALPAVSRDWAYYVTRTMKLLGALAIVGVCVVGLVVILNEIILRYP